MTGPAVFGSGFFTPESSGTGGLIGIYWGHVTPDVTGQITVPVGYISGTTITNSGIYDNATFASLGVTPGTYVWTWGSGADQSFTLNVVSTPGPIVGSGLPGLIAACGGFLAWWRRKRKAVAAVA